LIWALGRLPIKGTPAKLAAIVDAPDEQSAIADRGRERAAKRARQADGATTGLTVIPRLTHRGTYEHYDFMEVIIQLCKI
jgi:hypothetical protein